MPPAFDLKTLMNLHIEYNNIITDFYKLATSATNANIHIADILAWITLQKSKLYQSIGYLLSNSHTRNTIENIVVFWEGFEDAALSGPARTKQSLEFTSTTLNVPVVMLDNSQIVANYLLLENKCAQTIQKILNFCEYSCRQVLITNVISDLSTLFPATSATGFLDRLVDEEELYTAFKLTS